MPPAKFRIDAMLARSCVALPCQTGRHLGRVVKADPDISVFSLAKILLHFSFAQAANGPNHMGHDAHCLFKLRMGMPARFSVQFSLQMGIAVMSERISNDANQAVCDSIPDVQRPVQTLAHFLQ